MRVRYDSTEFIKARKELKSDGEHCAICGKDLPKYRRKYCSDGCYWSWHRVQVADGLLKDWKALRKQHLKEYPFCIKCRDKKKFIHNEDGLVNNLQVDHIIPIAKGGEEFDKRNLQTLCLRCHKEKTFNDFREYCRKCHYSHDKESKIYKKHIGFLKTIKPLKAFMGGGNESG